MQSLPKYQRVMIRLLIAGLALLTGYVSWGHGHHATLYFGESFMASILLPLVPDIAMVVSIFIRLVMPDNKWAKVSMISGILFTIWLNIMNVKIFPGDMWRTVGSFVLSLMTPFFLFLCIEMLFSVDSIAAKVAAAKESKLKAEADALEEIARAAREQEAREQAARDAEIARMAREAADKILAEKAAEEAELATLTPQQKGWRTRQAKLAAGE